MFTRVARFGFGGLVETILSVLFAVGVSSIDINHLFSVTAKSGY